MYKPVKLKGYKDAFTIKAKNRRFAVVKKEVEYKDYKETNLSYDFEEDFDNLEDEIGDMSNYFSN